MNFHAGIVPYRAGFKKVVLKDGEFHEMTEKHVKINASNKFDRNYHLHYMVNMIEDSLDGLDAHIIVDGIDYARPMKEVVEKAQTIGAILSMPYEVHVVSTSTWQTALIGKGGVTQVDVKREIDSRFQLQDKFEGKSDWYTAFCLGRFGYIKDQPDS